MTNEVIPKSPALTYIKGEEKYLRELGLDERWLQSRILDDPSILGLGDLVVLERERSQPSGGRVDFLMADPEEEEPRYYYEVEAMLGLESPLLLRCAAWHFPVS